MLLLSNKAMHVNLVIICSLSSVTLGSTWLHRRIGHVACVFFDDRSNNEPRSPFQPPLSFLSSSPLSKNQNGPESAQTGPQSQHQTDDNPMPTRCRMPTPFEQPTPSERPKRHISQNPSTSSAFYGPKGAWWNKVEQKYIAIVSR